MASTEKATQAAILHYLSFRKCLYWRQNSGAFTDTKGHFYRFSSVLGMPDVFVLKEGKLYGIEVKDVKGRQNENQIQFQSDFEKNGGVYVLARSLDDVTPFF